MTDLCRKALNTWEKPDFEWYVKAVCQAAAQKKEFYYNYHYIPLLWSYPASWSYQIFEDMLSKKEPFTNKTIIRNFLKDKAQSGAVPPVFQPLFDKYLTDKD